MEEDDDNSRKSNNYEKTEELFKQNPPTEIQGSYYLKLTCRSLRFVTLFHIYVGYSKIKFRLVGKNERVGVAPNHKLSRDKQCLLSLDTKPHAFSLRSLWVIADETW
jgi:hypothetical protein